MHLMQIVTYICTESKSFLRDMIAKLVHRPTSIVLAKKLYQSTFVYTFNEQCDSKKLYYFSFTTLHLPGFLWCLSGR